MSWAHIQGHDHWVEAFGRVVQQNRLAHAYLFIGPRGVGKRLFARELAKTLLCDNRNGKFEACGQCASCLLVDAQTHPDFFTVQRPEEKNEFPIELMRELCQGFSLKPARGHGKVAILDDADDLNGPSANCFLKTLEEPPPRSVFFLLGTSSEIQMPTILSRCQIVRFAPLPEALVIELLGRQGIDPTLAQQAARLAAGSPGQALALADPALWQFRETLLKGLSQPKPDTVALGKAFTQFAEEAGKETALHRRRAALVLQLLIGFLTDALALSLGGQTKMQGTENREMLRRMIERAGPEKILALLERCLETEMHLERYVQVGLVLEALLDSFTQQ